MKKAIKILFLLSFVFFIVSLIWTSFNKLAFYTKHISLFVMLGSSAYMLLELAYNRLLSKTTSDKKVITLGIIRVLSFFLLIVLIGTAQNRYIDTKDSYYNYACDLFDNHNNIIYQSQYYDSCPSIDSTEVQDDSLHLKLRESTYGFYEYYYYYNPYLNNDTYIYDQNISFTMLTDILIEYDELGNITKFKKQASEYITIGLNDTIISTITELDISYTDGEVEILITDGKSIDGQFNSMALRNIREVHVEDISYYREYSERTLIPEDHDEYLDVYFEDLNTNETVLVAHSDISEYGTSFESDEELPGYQIVTATEYMQGINQDLRTFIHKNNIRNVELTAVGLPLNDGSANNREYSYHYEKYNQYGDILSKITHFVNTNSTTRYIIDDTFNTSNSDLVMYVKDAQGDRVLEFTSTEYGSLLKKYERFESDFLFGDTREEYIEQYRSNLHPKYSAFNTGTNLYNYYRFLDIKRDSVFPSDLIYQRIPFYYEYYKLYE